MSDCGPTAPPWAEGCACAGPCACALPPHRIDPDRRRLPHPVGLRRQSRGRRRADGDLGGTGRPPRARSPRGLEQFHDRVHARGDHRGRGLRRGRQPGLRHRLPFPGSRRSAREPRIPGRARPRSRSAAARSWAATRSCSRAPPSGRAPCSARDRSCGPRCRRGRSGRAIRRGSSATRPSTRAASRVDRWRSGGVTAGSPDPSTWPVPRHGVAPWRPAALRPLVAVGALCLQGLPGRPVPEPDPALLQQPPRRGRRRPTPRRPGLLSVVLLAPAVLDLRPSRG